MTETTDRPLVTFALFAYNQEQYIREAVEGAFSQTYEPLEIILSDDCSTDRTYEIMQEMAAAYEGPHVVRLRRNPWNLNIGGHVRELASVARGDIIVMAAGDDISMHHRVTAHVELYEAKSSAYAVFSDAVLFGNGYQSELKKFWHANFLKKIRKKTIAFRGGGVGSGATYSYRKMCFHEPHDFPEFYHTEDRILPLRASILGDVYYIPKKLVAMRVTESSVSRNVDYEMACAREDFQSELVREVDMFVRKGFLEARSAVKISKIINSNPHFWSRLIKKEKFYSSWFFYRWALCLFKDPIWVIQKIIYKVNPFSRKLAQIRRLKSP
ncbi:glycosyltransferase [Spiribacter sp. C176]|uniref:Glycosyltransferase n=1 Tax=Spiribacter salilacus TaxID=2664894 RepID=A0A6N7QSX2_9GAMM|nr:glycosyltransferase [Spiribacter salilacus]MRH78509.1 glycosyltransferase [Spiribacter salilacus]